MSGHKNFRELHEQLRARLEAEQKSPPWSGYKQVEEVPYPMTVEEFYRWPREPGWKYELHAGMCVRLWVGPSAFYGGFAILRAYQPAEQRYIISVPELPGCQAELHTSGLPDLEAWEQSIQKGAEAIDRWIAAAWAAATQDDHVSVPVVSLPKTLEEPPEEPLTHLKEVGLIPIETEADYKLAVAVLYALVDRTGCDPTHPLDEVLAVLTDQVEAYEDVHHPI